MICFAFKCKRGHLQPVIRQVMLLFSMHRPLLLNQASGVLLTCYNGKQRPWPIDSNEKLNIVNQHFEVVISVTHQLICCDGKLMVNIEY